MDQIKNRERFDEMIIKMTKIIEHKKEMNRAAKSLNGKTFIERLNQKTDQEIILAIENINSDLIQLNNIIEIIMGRVLRIGIESSLKSMWDVTHSALLETRSYLLDFERSFVIVSQHESKTLDRRLCESLLKQLESKIARLESLSQQQNEIIPKIVANDAIDKLIKMKKEREKFERAKSNFWIKPLLLLNTVIIAYIGFWQLCPVEN